MFWALMGYLPLLLYALLLYWILRFIFRSFRTQLKSATVNVKAGQGAESDEMATLERRRRAIVSSSSQKNKITSAHSSVHTAVRSEYKAKPSEPEPPRPSPITESIAVVLRRQVPPGPMDLARSWLGGLPRMPENIAWPRSVSSEHPQNGERPLHFLAQICCADLPRDLWGGLGPREGWLLLFIDPNQGYPEGSDAFRIIHVSEAGPERLIPLDLGPVHDGVYTGRSYRWLPQEQIPSTWRRWPVDIVTFPNVLIQNEVRGFATPEEFAAELYEGAPVLPYQNLNAIRPYSTGQALRAVRDLSAGMRVEPRPVANQYVHTLLFTEGSIVNLRATLVARLEKIAESGKGEMRSYQVEHINRCLALIDDCETPDSLLKRLEEAREEQRSWRLSIAEECDRLVDWLDAQAYDTPLSAEQWEDLQARFSGKQWTGFEFRVDHPRDGSKQLDLRDYVEQVHLGIPKGMKEEAMADWLDPKTRPLVPMERVGELEAAARSLTSNRPHRMGGYHDGVQSDAIEGFKRELLLFQIASDESMDWCWGDVGAYYFWISPEHLAAGDFSSVEVWFECH